MRYFRGLTHTRVLIRQFRICLAKDFNERFFDLSAVFSGAPAARRAAKRSPVVLTGKKRKPMKDFLMVIVASGIARGRVGTTTTTESRNMAAMLTETYRLGLPCTFLILDIRCYDQLTPVKTSYPLTSIT